MELPIPYFIIWLAASSNWAFLSCLSSYSSNLGQIPTPGARANSVGNLPNTTPCTKWDGCFIVVFSCGLFLFTIYSCVHGQCFRAYYLIYTSYVTALWLIGRCRLSCSIIVPHSLSEVKGKHYHRESRSQEWVNLKPFLWHIMPFVFLPLPRASLQESGNWLPCLIDDNILL